MACTCVLRACVAEDGDGVAATRDKVLEAALDSQAMFTTKWDHAPPGPGFMSRSAVSRGGHPSTAALYRAYAGLDAAVASGAVAASATELWRCRADIGDADAGGIQRDNVTLVSMLARERATVASLRQELSASEAQVQEGRGCVTGLLDRLRACRMELDREKAAREADAVQRAEHLEARARHIAALSEELERCRRGRAAVEEEVAVAKAARAKAQSELEAAQDEVHRLKSMYDNVKADRMTAVAEERAHTAAAQAEVARLKGEATSATALLQRITQLEDALALAQGSVTEEVRRAGGVGEAAAAAAAQRDAATAAAETAQGEAMQAAEEIVTLRRQLAELTCELNGQRALNARRVNLADTLLAMQGRQLAGRVKAAVQSNGLAHLALHRAKAQTEREVQRCHSMCRTLFKCLRRCMMRQELVVRATALQRAFLMWKGRALSGAVPRTAVLPVLLARRQRTHAFALLCRAVARVVQRRQRLARAWSQWRALPARRGSTPPPPAAEPAPRTLPPAAAVQPVLCYGGVQRERQAERVARQGAGAAAKPPPREHEAAAPTRHVRKPVAQARVQPTRHVRECCHHAAAPAAQSAPAPPPVWSRGGGHRHCPACEQRSVAQVTSHAQERHAAHTRAVAEYAPVPAPHEWVEVGRVDQGAEWSDGEGSEEEVSDFDTPTSESEGEEGVGSAYAPRPAVDRPTVLSAWRTALTRHQQRQADEARHQHQQALQPRQQPRRRQGHQHSRQQQPQQPRQRRSPSPRHASPAPSVQWADATRRVGAGLARAAEDLRKIAPPSHRQTSAPPAEALLAAQGTEVREEASVADEVDAASQRSESSVEGGGVSFTQGMDAVAAGFAEGCVLLPPTAVQAIADESGPAALQGALRLADYLALGGSVGSAALSIPAPRHVGPSAAADMFTLGVLQSCLLGRTEDAAFTWAASYAALLHGAAQQGGAPKSPSGPVDTVALLSSHNAWMSIRSQAGMLAARAEEHVLDGAMRGKWKGMWNTLYQRCLMFLAWHLGHATRAFMALSAAPLMPGGGHTLRVPTLKQPLTSFARLPPRVVQGVGRAGAALAPPLWLQAPATLAQPPPSAALDGSGTSMAQVGHGTQGSGASSQGGATTVPCLDPPLSNLLGGAAPHPHSSGSQAASLLHGRLAAFILSTSHGVLGDVCRLLVVLRHMRRLFMAQASALDVRTAGDATALAALAAGGGAGALVPPSSTVGDEEGGGGEGGEGGHPCCPGPTDLRFVAGEVVSVWQGCSEAGAEDALVLLQPPPSSKSAGADGPMLQSRRFWQVVTTPLPTLHTTLATAAAQSTAATQGTVHWGAASQGAASVTGLLQHVSWAERHAVPWRSVAPADLAAALAPPTPPAKPREKGSETASAHMLSDFGTLLQHLFQCQLLVRAAAAGGGGVRGGEQGGVHLQAGHRQRLVLESHISEVVLQLNLFVAFAQWFHSSSPHPAAAEGE